MKTKLLKKVRRRYSWRWDAENYYWVVTDRKSGKTYQFPWASDFVVNVAYDFIGLNTGCNYEIRLAKRGKWKLYYKAVNRTVVPNP